MLAHIMGCIKVYSGLNQQRKFLWLEQMLCYQIKIFICLNNDLANVYIILETCEQVPATLCRLWYCVCDPSSLNGY